MSETIKIITPLPVNGSIIRKGKPKKVTEEKLTQEFLDQITRYCMLGVNDSMICEFLGLSAKSRMTLDKYRKDYPVLDQAIKKGKEYADSNVAAALYRRATGYDIIETTIETGIGANGMPVNKEKTVTKHYAPDPASIIFWLKNKAPESWADRREYVSKETQTDFENISNEELETMIETLKKELSHKKKDDSTTENEE